LCRLSLDVSTIVEEPALEHQIAKKSLASKQVAERLSQHTASFLFPVESIVIKCKGLVVNEAACSSETSHFAKLLAVKPRFEFEPLSSQHAGFSSSFRCLRYTRDFGPAAGGCGVSISI
jgi:hypothetical protein